MPGAHIVGLHDAGDGTMPRLVLRDEVGVRLAALEGAFQWRLSGDRHCIGRWTDGRHVPCPEQQLLTQDYVCRACSGLEHPECVFEPLCQDDPKSCMCLASFGGVEHVVYLAFHGILPKVGLTQAWRVERRLREQGADAYFVVRGGLDRATARNLERQVGFRNNVPEFRTHKETFGALVRPVPWDAVLARAEGWREKLATEHPVGLVQRVQHPAFGSPLPSTPRLMQAYGEHDGTWLGAKGNHVFYAEARRPDRLDAGVPVVALRRSDLMGRALNGA